MKITKLNLVKTKPILYTNAHAQMNSSITRLPYAATQHHTYVRTYIVHFSHFKNIGTMINNHKCFSSSIVHSLHNGSPRAHRTPHSVTINAMKGVHLRTYTWCCTQRRLRLYICWPRGWVPTQQRRTSLQLDTIRQHNP